MTPRSLRTSWRRVILLFGAALLVSPAAAGAQSARSLAMGYADGVFLGDADTRGPWLTRAAGTGADILRIEIGWVAPNTATRPPDFDARDPADPAYSFTIADAAIVDATARGLRVLATFTRAPRWAEGPNRPAGVTPGSWQPDPRALEEYGAALARRYSGSFPDPARPGRLLPRIAAFQVWNEPNLDKYLTPLRKNGRSFAPAHYRRMLTAFHRGANVVRPAPLVVTGAWRRSATRSRAPRGTASGPRASCARCSAYAR